MTSFTRRFTASLIALTMSIAGVAHKLMAADAAPQRQPAAPSRVAYVIDGSGSMSWQWRSVIDEVAKSWDGLKDGQAAAIVLVDESGAYQVGWKGMTPPRDAHKQVAWETLLKHKPDGIADLKGAVREAAKLRPQIVWLITDGDIANEDEVVNSIVTTAGKAFVVNTVAAFAEGDDDAAKAGLNALRKISRRTGGKCVGDKGPPAAPQRPRGPSVLALQRYVSR